MDFLAVGPEQIRFEFSSPAPTPDANSCAHCCGHHDGLEHGRHPKNYTAFTPKPVFEFWMVAIGKTEAVVFEIQGRRQKIYRVLPQNQQRLAASTRNFSLLKFPSRPSKF
jgi:hypothetical protein